MYLQNLYKKIFNCWYDEFHQDTRFGLKGKLIIEENTTFQKITILKSYRYGKALLLNNCWMTAEFQEKQYHECLVHPALSSAEQITKILIIGGGDGGSARECLLYDQVEHIDLIEIDNRVIELCQKHLGCIGGKAWNDKRLNIKIQDGIEWVKESEDNSYDVVIVDGSDPQGPALGLFNRDFFENCHRILKRGGVFSTQTESPEAFEKVHIETLKIIREIFEYADPLYGSVPIYPSGFWSWTFGAKDKQRYLEPLLERTMQISEKCEIWSPRWQKGAFNIIPASLERKINQ